jgi:cadmium resistance protein CadD (predicted permease)
MNWILLLYVLPLVVSIVEAYFLTKKEEGDVKEFLQILPYLAIPLVGIIAVVAGICFIIGDWIEKDESIQNFLNKKL